MNYFKYEIIKNDIKLNETFQTILSDILTLKNNLNAIKDIHDYQNKKINKENLTPKYDEISTYLIQNEQAIIRLYQRRKEETSYTISSMVLEDKTEEEII
jgi:hypothetical protein